MKKRHIIISTLLLALSSGFMTAFAAECSPLPVSAAETVVEGDCNGDGQFLADDAMLLQNWLTGSGQLNNWLGADLNGDSFIDSFDLTLMRQKLNEQIEQVFETTAGYSLRYVKAGGEVTVTGFVKTSEAESVRVRIPKKIDGCPVTKIGAFAFYNAAIYDVIIPDSVVSLGDYAFAACPNLKSVTLSKNLRTELSGGYLFFNSIGIEKIYASGNMTDPTFIDHFNYHTSTIIEGTLTGELYDLNYQISIGDGTVVISSYQPSDATGISVTIPEKILGRNVTTIGSKVFMSTDICEVFLPDTVTKIEPWAFAFCYDLTKVVLSKNLINTYNPEGRNSFAQCKQLKDVIVPEDMVDPESLEMLFNTPWGIEYFSARIDEKVDEVYNALKAANSDIDWNIADAEGQARENAKYEVAKYIHSQLAGNLIIYNTEVNFHESAYSLVRGFGACAGMSRSYILLLLKAGFTPEDVQLVSAPQHALAGIQLYNQWYFVECTDNNSKSFGMTYQNEWYRGTPEGEYDGYYDDDDPYHYYFHYPKYCNDDEESEALLAEWYRSNYDRGDVNMDGTTDSKDYSLLENYLNGNSVSINLVNADVNYDGIIDSTDLSVINSISIGEMNFMDIVIKNYGKPF